MYDEGSETTHQIIEVWHQSMLRVQELSHVLRCLLAVVPRYTVRDRTVQTRMRTEQSECDPALVDLLRRVAFETADVVAGEREAGRRQAQTTAQCFCHGLEGRLAVATPVLWQLASDSAR